MKVRKENYIKWLLVFTAIACVRQAAAQYAVTGGAKPPILAVDGANIQVYLVYGMDNVQISYTSSSTTHYWRRYQARMDLLDPETVPSVQNGQTSAVTGVEEGYGYYVDDKGAMNKCVWIIDYSRYEISIQHIGVSPDADPCMALRLNGDADIKDMIYNTPEGTPTKVKREFEIRYETLVWNESAKLFTQETHTEKTDRNPFETSFMSPPLMDTEITLAGDMYARQWGIEQSAAVPFYEAKAIEIHADTVVSYSTPRGNASASEEELQAPAAVTFTAYANTPVAAMFTWKIFRNEEPDRPLIVYNHEEVAYTFDRAGAYTARLEASDRAGVCIDNSSVFRINITETVMDIPNAFSPGCTPGINDIFRVNYRSVVKFQGWIFNRWGNEVFHWTDPSQGWDGKYKGQYVPAGAFYYLIEYTGTDGKSRVRKGDVNVFRTKDGDS